VKGFAPEKNYSLVWRNILDMNLSDFLLSSISLSLIFQTDCSIDEESRFLENRMFHFFARKLKNFANIPGKNK